MLLSEMIRKKAVRREAVPAFSGHCDVLVAGLGTSGAPAALAAAEAGARVCAVEKLNLPGGTATARAASPDIITDSPAAVSRKTDALAQQLRVLSFIEGGHFHPDAKIMATDRELTAAGVELRYETGICGVWLDDDGATVRGARLVSKEGVSDVECRILIDGTGNGDVCALAGAGFTEGRASDGQPQPFSSVRVFRSENRFASANFDAGFTTSTDAAELNRAVIDSNSLHCFPPGGAPPGPALLYHPASRSPRSKAHRMRPYAHGAGDHRKELERAAVRLRLQQLRQPLDRLGVRGRPRLRLDGRRQPLGQEYARPAFA